MWRMKAYRNILLTVGFLISGFAYVARAQSGEVSNAYVARAQSGEVSNTALNKKEQSIIAISAFTANGDLPKLNEELNAGLDGGLTINEIKEVLVQLYAYAGFPRSLNALNTFMSVLNTRKQKGINDPAGREPSPLPKNTSMLDFGTQMQTKLVGRPVAGEVYEFAPAIDQFLKAHLFGAIFGRDNLDWKTREIATISALAAISGVENQLRSHFNVGRYNGLTEEQLKGIVSVLRQKVGSTEGNRAGRVLGELSTDSTSTGTTNSEDETANIIFPRGSKISNQNFTGTAWLQMLVENDTALNTSVGSVTFEPGTRTNWHRHPGGQILLVISGKGLYQEKGSAIRELRKGEVIKCLPNIVHWHGATPKDEMR
jgi:4-carboxymuconolactone decarboxylase